MRFFKNNFEFIRQEGPDLSNGFLIGEIFNDQDNCDEIIIPPDAGKTRGQEAGTKAPPPQLLQF